MRIAHVNQDRGVGPDRAKGAAVHLLAMREAFAAAGAEVVAIDERDPDALTARLAQAHAEAPLAMVYERYSLEAEAASLFAAEAGVPHVLEVNAPLRVEVALYRPESRPESSPEDRPGAATEFGAPDAVAGEAVIEPVERRILARAARVLCVSESTAEWARGQGADPGSVIVRPNGVDTRRFRPRRAGDRLRAEIAAPGTCVLGFHGRLRPWHGFDGLVECARRLLARGRDVHLCVVGTGDFDAALQDFPSERLTRSGWLPHAEVARWVAAFDLLPLTYAAAPDFWFSPLKLREAMACGVVPLVPDVGDLSAAVEDGKAGLVYPAGDLEELVAAIEGLLDEPRRRKSLARSARQAAGKVTWSGIAQELLGTLVGSAG